MTETARPVGQPVRAPKTAELIAAHLRKQIVRGELRTGDGLPSEALLMAQFGVSRPTLREAFRILETESLIAVRRGARGGAQVMAPDLSVAARYVGVLLQIRGTTIEDVYQARTVLEPACAARLARGRTPQDLADLRACIGELREVVEAGADHVPDAVQWARSTYRFHELVLQRSGNKTLAVQGGVLQDIVATHYAVSLTRNLHDPDTAEQFRRMLRSYDRLVDLVEAQDAEGAERHWRMHMEVAGRTLLRDDLKSKRVVDLFN